MTELYPIECKRLEFKGILITWSDGEKHTINSRELRLHCPCATCRETRGEGSHDAPLRMGSVPSTSKKSLLRVVEHTADEQTHLEQIWPIGNYALGMRWKDGHDTGIYTFEYLRKLAPVT